MKKLLTIALALIYLTFTTGVVISTHFCMGKQAGVSLSSGAETEDCHKCGMKSVEGCCENKVEILKVEDTHQATPLNDIPFAPLHLFLDAQPVAQPPVEAPACVVCRKESPPAPDIPLNILHSVFRI